MSYKKYECPNVLCRASNCFKHCKHCGIEVKWINYLGNPHYETNNKGNKVRIPYENNDSVHRCSKLEDKKKKNLNESEDYFKLDEYRSLFRLGQTALFKCTFCGERGELPRMLKHHDSDMYKCKDKLMAQFFKEKPKTYIDVKNYRLDDY